MRKAMMVEIAKRAITWAVFSGGTMTQMMKLAVQTAATLMSPSCQAARLRPLSMLQAVARVVAGTRSAQPKTFAIVTEMSAGCGDMIDWAAAPRMTAAR